MGNGDPSPMALAKDAVDLSGDVASAVKSSSVLWESALAKLPSDARAEIKANGVKLSDLTAIYAEAEKKQKAWEDEQMKFKFRGREYKAGEIWATIVHSIGAFKSFFGKLVALDVSGKAALPWAVISLVLRALEYKTDQLETIGGAMSTIVEVIRYYVAFEALYQNEDWLVVRELKSAVIDVYADILRVLCLAKAYYTKKGASNPHKHVSLLFYDPDIFKRKLQSIEEGNSKVENWARLVRREAEQKISNRVREIQTHLQRLTFRADMECLSSISSLNDHVDQSRGRLRDTGMWLMNHEDFQSWRHSQSSALLMLTGSVGTGKTMLTSLVIDGFLYDFQTVARSPALYFYSRTGQDPEEVLRNFVRQLILARSDPFESFDEKFRGGAKLSASDCWGRIESFIKTQDSVAIIIDALDNCSTDTSEALERDRNIPSSYTFLNLFRDLVEVMKRSPRPVKVFASSQSTSEGLLTAFRGLKRGFDNQFFEISTDKQPTDDIARVVKHEVESWASGQLLPNLDQGAGRGTKIEGEAIRNEVRASIIKTVSKKAERMFTWAILILRRRLRDNKALRTVEDVDDELKADHIPRTLEDLYDDTFDILYGSQSSPSSRKSGSVIKILFCAKKELSSSAFIEAAEAVSVPFSLGMTYEQIIHDLVSSCLGWVRYDTERDVFQFQHPSVQRYLQKKCEHANFEAQSHATMAEACLKIVVAVISRRNSFAKNTEDSDADTDANRTDLSPTRRSFRRGRGSNYGQASHIPESQEASGIDSEDDEPRAREPVRNMQRNTRTVLSSPRRRSGSKSSRASRRSESESRPRSRVGSSSTASISDDEDDRSKARYPGRSTWAHDMMSDPVQDFQEYATLYWVSHYQACTDTTAENGQLRKYVKDIFIYGGGRTNSCDIFDLNGYFHRWIEGIQKFFSQRPLGYHSKQVETELEHCLYPPPSPFRVGCVYGLAWIVEEIAEFDALDSEIDGSEGLLMEGLSVSSRRSSVLSMNDMDMNGLHLASKFGHVKTLRFLGSLKSATEDLLTLDNQGKTSLQYAVEAATDTVLVKEILKIPSAKELRTTSGVLAAAMRNTSCAQDLVRLLLGGTPASYRRVSVENKTYELAVAAISYPFTTLDLVKHVTVGRMFDWEIINDEAASSTGREVKWKQREKIWEWLLQEERRTMNVLGRPRSATIDASVKTADPELLRFLRRQAGERTLDADRSTFHLALSQARHLHELVDVMLEFVDVKGVDDDNLVGTALNNPHVDDALISKLVEHLDRGTELDSDKLIDIAKNRRQAAALLESVTKVFCLPSDVPSLRHALKVAVGKGNAEVVKMFLRHLEHLSMPLIEVETLIGEVVASSLDIKLLSKIKQKCAALAPANPLSVSEVPENYWDGVIAECLRVFASKMPPSSRLSQPLAEEIALIRGRKTMEVLLDHPAARNQESPVCISKGMKLAAASNKIYGFELLQFFDQRAAQDDVPPFDEVFVDDDILQAAARHGGLRSLTFLLGNRPLEHHSKDFMLAAAENTDSAVVEYVFRKLHPNLIGMDELETAAATSDTVFDCVLRHYDSRPQQESARLSAIIANKCRRSKSLLGAFRRGVAREPASADGFRELIGEAVNNIHGVEMASFLLKRYQMTDKRIRISEELLSMAAGNSSVAPEMLRLLLGQCKDRWVESIVTPDVLSVAASNGREAPEALRILLLECTSRQSFAFGMDNLKQVIDGAINRNPNLEAKEEAKWVFSEYVEVMEKIGLFRSAE